MFSLTMHGVLFCMCMQVPVSYWGADSGEGDFTFYKGQLLAGCMDKAQFGKFGLVHAMQVRPGCMQVCQYVMTGAITSGWVALQLLLSAQY
jgi:hypothetical protein